MFRVSTCLFFYTLKGETQADVTLSGRENPKWARCRDSNWRMWKFQQAVEFSRATNAKYLCLPISSYLIYPITARVVGAPQMISQPVFSIFPCSPLPSGTCRTPGMSIPWCCLPTSSSVFIVFFSLSLCLARWFWPDLMNGKHDHTTAVCVSLRSSGSLRVVRLPAGSRHGLFRW